MKTYNPLLGCCLAALSGSLMMPSSAFSQEVNEDAGGESEPARGRTDIGDSQMNESDILVLGERLRAQVDTEQAPILELGREDIAAFGAGSIADLVAALEPQTGSSRGRGGGRPVFLINGVPVGSFREFRSYPPEAIEKVEVLPEETAQKFGYPPDRRVVNFILKDNYSSVTIAGEYEMPDRGGYAVTEQEATLLKIAKGARINFNIQANDTSLLTEAERKIVQTPASIPGVVTDPDPAEYRSLISDTASFKADANLAKSFTDSSTAITLNGTFQRSDARSLSGLDSVILTNPAGNSLLRTLGAEDPLERRNRTDIFSTSGSLNRPLGDFIMSLTADGSYSTSRTEIDRRADTAALASAAAAGNLAIDGPLPELPDAGFDIASQKTYSASSKATLRGAPLYVPAGEVNTTFDLGYDWTRIESDDTRSGAKTSLRRGDISGGLNISVPVTSTRDNVLAALGSITLTGQIGFNNYSDFGTLYRWSGGMNWSPADKLDLQATYTWREAPPSLSQLGSPEVTSFNVATFDFATGNTALVTVTSGGNPSLKAETQSDWNFTANWEFIDNARFQIGYSRNNSENVSSSFPFLTPEIEAAFPDRVTRDAGGGLSSVDLRPVDFFQTRSENLSLGLNFNGAIGKAPEPEAGNGEGRPAGSEGRRSPGAGSERGRGGGNGPAGGFRGGPPSEEQRAAMQAFRERVCADDGGDFLLRLAAAADRGEPMAELPDFDPALAKRMLERFRKEDGSLDTEKFAGFRERMCSMESGPGGRAPDAASARGAAPRSGGPRGGRGGGRFGPGGDGRARFFFNLNHNIALNSEVLIAPGGPLLDLLDGDSLSSSGNPKNTTRLEAGLFKGGLGLRLSGSYTGTARIDGSGAVGSNDLFIDDLAKFDLRIFADLGAALKKEDGILKGLRIAFRADNLFDGRRQIRDGNGEIPLSFQPLLIDPTGRYIGVDLRKQF